MERPTPVTLFGILNIIFGIFAFYGVAATQAMLYAADPTNPILNVMHKYPAYATWAHLTTTLNILAGFVLLAAGVGLLRMVEWARKLSIGYALYAIPYNITVAVMDYLYIYRPPTDAGAAATPVFVSVVEATMGSIYGLAFPIILLFFMLRKDIVAAFRPQAEPPVLPA